MVLANYKKIIICNSKQTNKSTLSNALLILKINLNFMEIIIFETRKCLFRIAKVNDTHGRQNFDVIPPCTPIHLHPNWWHAPRKESDVGSLYVCTLQHTIWSVSIYNTLTSTKLVTETLFGSRISALTAKYHWNLRQIKDQYQKCIYCRNYFFGIKKVYQKFSIQHSGIFSTV